jgi:hypothetical protein
MHPEVVFIHHNTTLPVVVSLRRLHTGFTGFPLPTKNETVQFDFKTQPSQT